MGEVYWKAAAASVRGVSHEKTGKPCQDASLWEILLPCTLAVVVADGAGSASLGEIGASVASQAALGTIQSQMEGSFVPFSVPHFVRNEDKHSVRNEDKHSVRNEDKHSVRNEDKHSVRDEDRHFECSSQDKAKWQPFLREAMEAAMAAVEREAQNRKVPARELATTLIVTLATPSLVVSAQIGDGAVVVGDGEGKIFGLTKPQRGEYINETTFLISPEALHTAQMEVWEGNTAHIAVITDGLQMLALKMPEATPHTPFFAPLFHFIAASEETHEAQEEMEKFLRSPRVAQRADDDLTLVLGTLAKRG
jgi:serine/threonine protein phosphatase PrpC